MHAYKLQLNFCLPKYWLAWISILLLFISSLLPYSCLLFLGKWLGRGAYLIVKNRAQVARRNLALCFPNLTDTEIEQKVQRNFENSGIALFEMGMAWFWPTWRVHKHLKITGLEHLQKANAQNKGIIFMGAHFLTIEMGARTLGLIQPSYAVYRPHSNAVLDYWFYKGRMREHKGMLDRTDFRSMLRVLKKGNALWYAPDHDYGPYRSSVFAPFFSVEKVNTVSGTSTLARIKNTSVIPVFLKRLAGTQGYELIFYPALENFPSNDLEADSTLTNQTIEQMILECDDQYMWMHRRFKTRPKGETSLYN